MCCSKYFICANSFNHHNSPVMQGLILSLFYILGTEELLLFTQGSGCKIVRSQVVNLCEPSHLAVEFMLSSSCCQSFCCSASQEWPRTPNDGPGPPSVCNSQRWLLVSSCLSVVPSLFLAFVAVSFARGVLLPAPSLSYTHPQWAWF